jgi:hypothetical protein
MAADKARAKQVKCNRGADLSVDTIGALWKVS